MSLTMLSTLSSALRAIGPRRLGFAGVVICGLVLAIDLSAPLGVAAGVLYTLPVGLGLASRNGRMALTFAALGSLLTVLGLLLSPDGRSPDVYVVANRLLSLVAIWTVAMVVRAQVLLQERLAMTREQLRDHQELVRLGHVAAVVAHEVKNPLAGVLGALQVVATRLDERSPEARVLGRAMQRLEDLGRTTEDLLAFARPSQPIKAQVDLLELLTTTAEEAARGRELPVPPVEGPALVVETDPRMLRQAVGNLVLNALEASSDAVELRLDASDDAVRIEVLDQGPGISEEVMARIFEPFFTTRTRGTGLGLPIVKGLVEALGGTVSLQAADGGGTLATIVLPGPVERRATQAAQAPALQRA